MKTLQKLVPSKYGKDIRVISFFTGAGGLDLGFDLAGFDVVYATDIDAMCCKTLEANLGGLLSINTTASFLIYLIHHLVITSLYKCSL
jgi:DNA (cytosine-5)-methyltransferase 1